MAVQAIPEGYHSVTPYLIVSGGARAIEFYKKAFGAVELLRFDQPDGKVAHAELKIGDSPIMLGDEHPEMGARSPKTIGGSPVGILLYVPDVDRVFAAAVAAGAEVLHPLEDKFYGDRTGTVTDPFGHQWTVSTHVEDVTQEEVERRMKAMQGKGGGA